jgi:6-phosphogluconolactonase (cycloisomerase 2 family)
MRHLFAFALLLASLSACAPAAESHPAQPVTYAISGQLTGSVVAGVPVTLKGLSLWTGITVSTDPNGRFAFSGLRRGNYELAPAPVVTYSPARRFLTVAGADLTGQDFAGEQGLRLHGKVTVAGPGVPPGQVAITIQGPAGLVRYSDDSGYWSASGLPAGSYTITPARAGWVFSPPVVSVAVAGGVVAQDFAAVAFAGTPHAISGTVTGPSLAGVMVRLTGDNAATVPVAASGAFNFPNLADGSYTLYAAGPDLLFRPGSRRVVLAGADAAGRDFATFAPPPARFAYANNNGGDSVYQFRVMADGSFQPLTPATVPTGRGPRALVVDPAGRWLWVLNQTSSSISQFAIGAEGLLTPLSPVEVAVGQYPWDLSIHPSGKAVYVTGLNYSTSNVDLYQLAVGADGSLSPLTPASFSYGGSEGANAAFDATGAFAYFASRYGVSQFSVAADGALTPLDPATVATPGPGTWTFSVTVSSEAGVAYVMSQNGVDLYAVGSDGLLSPLDPPRTSVDLTSPYAMALDPGGRAAWMVSQAAMQASAYALRPDGLLGPSLGTWPGFPYHPRLPVADPTGRWLYVPVVDGVTQLAVAPNGGLSVVTTIPAPGAISMVLVR